MSHFSIIESSIDWLYHIAGVTISCCLKQAMASSVDPRSGEGDDSIEWSEWTKSLYEEDDLKKIWWYIGKQVLVISKCNKN